MTVALQLSLNQT